MGRGSTLLNSIFRPAQPSQHHTAHPGHPPASSSAPSWTSPSTHTPAPTTLLYSPPPRPAPPPPPLHPPTLLRMLGGRRDNASFSSVGSMSKWAFTYLLAQHSKSGNTGGEGQTGQERGGVAIKCHSFIEPVSQPVRGSLCLCGIPVHITISGCGVWTSVPVIRPGCWCDVGVPASRWTCPVTAGK